MDIYVVVKRTARRENEYDLILLPPPGRLHASRLSALLLRIVKEEQSGKVGSGLDLIRYQMVDIPIISDGR